MAAGAFLAPFCGTVKVSGYAQQALSSRVCIRRRRASPRRLSRTCAQASDLNSGDDTSAGDPVYSRVLTEGDVVAVMRGSGAAKAELGLVIGTDSSGRNVDFAPLRVYVPELYVRADAEKDFIRADKVRRVPATWVPQQSGWIVLDADVADAQADIVAAPASLKATVVEVRDAPPRPPLGDLPPRPAFRPTRAQAFAGAALSIPISAIAYAVFVGERKAFVDVEGALQDVALVGAAAASVLSLIVGGALFLYAVNLPKDKQK